MPRFLSYSPEEAKKNKLFIQEYNLMKIEGVLDFKIVNVWLEYQGEYNGYTNKLNRFDKKSKNFILHLKSPFKQEEKFDNIVMCFDKSHLKKSYGFGIGKYERFLNTHILKEESIKDNIKITLGDKDCNKIVTTLYFVAKK